MSLSPNRLPRRWLAALFTVCLACLAMPAAAAHEVTDDGGHTTRFEQAPMRIVSLLPSLTESVCALDACERLIAVDRYSNWPASLQALPRVGSGLTPNIEAIVALRPDVVLMPGSSRVAARLRALGLRVLTLEARTQADVRRVLQTLAAALALPQQHADQVWSRIDADVTAAAQSVPGPARGARVFFEASSGPYAAGETSFIGEILTRLGARNTVDATHGPFPRLSPEFVLRAQPDLLMATSRTQIHTAPYPGWQRLSALRQGRLCVFSAEETDLIIRPGPRMGDAARVLAKCLAEKGASEKSAATGQGVAAR